MANKNILKRRFFGTDIKHLAEISIDRKRSSMFLLDNDILTKKETEQNPKIKEQLISVIEQTSFSSYLKTVLTTKTFLHKEGRWELEKSVRVSGIKNPNIRRKLYLILSNTIANMKRYEGYYDSLQKMVNVQLNDTNKIITNDVERTFVNRITEKQKSQLHRILLSYAKRNKELAYCQGMSLIGYFFLDIGFKEEEAFWLLVHVIEDKMGSYYYKDMTAVSSDIGLFKQLLLTTQPKLVKHFQTVEIDLNQFLINWFITIFTALNNDRVG